MKDAIDDVAIDLGDVLRALDGPAAITLAGDELITAFFEGALPLQLPADLPPEIAEIIEVREEGGAPAPPSKDDVKKAVGGLRGRVREIEGALKDAEKTLAEVEGTLGKGKTLRAKAQDLRDAVKALRRAVGRLKAKSAAGVVGKTVLKRLAKGLDVVVRRSDTAVETLERAKKRVAKARGSIKKGRGQVRGTRKQIDAVEKEYLKLRRRAKGAGLDGAVGRADRKLIDLTKTVDEQLTWARKVREAAAAAKAEAEKIRKQVESAEKSIDTAVSWLGGVTTFFDGLEGVLKKAREASSAVDWALWFLERGSKLLEWAIKVVLDNTPIGEWLDQAIKKGLEAIGATDVFDTLAKLAREGFKSLEGLAEQTKLGKKVRKALEGVAGRLKSLRELGPWLDDLGKIKEKLDKARSGDPGAIEDLAKAVRDLAKRLGKGTFHDLLREAFGRLLNSLNDLLDDLKDRPDLTDAQRKAIEKLEAALDALGRKLMKWQGPAPRPKRPVRPDAVTS